MMSGEDILGNLEDMMGNTAAPLLGIPQDSGQDSRHAALAVVAPDVRERLLHIALDHQIDKQDPAWLLVEAAVVSINAATAAGRAASAIHDDVTSIPGIIQKAVVSGGEDVSGQVRIALVSNLGEFAQAIGQGVHLATDNAVTNVQTALKDFDKKVDKAIIAKRDAVVAQWVQSGSDALDKKVREAIKTERTINLIFMLFMILATFILGIVLGMYLHF
ncbi:MAG: hypothetical protein ACYCQL_04945 [Acidithiobacillus sp.]